MATKPLSTLSDFYVYALVRGDTGVPFYIGKGRRNRWLNHEQAARKGAWGHKCAIIRDLHARGLDVIKIRLHEGLTDAVSHEYEVALIKAIGRGDNGPLVNLTDGGDGARGIKLSPETIAKRSASVRGSKRSPAACANMSAAQRGRKVSPESAAKIGAANRGRKRTPEAIAKSSAKLRGRKISPDAVAKSAATRRGTKRSVEARARMSAGRQGMKLSPEHRANIGAAGLGKKHSAASRAKMSAWQIGRKMSPEAIAKAVAGRRASLARRRAEAKSD